MPARLLETPSRLPSLAVKTFRDAVKTFRDSAKTAESCRQDIWRYSAHGQNTSVASFAQDNVFSDCIANQLAVVTGSVASGYTATLTVGVAV